MSRGITVGVVGWWVLAQALVRPVDVEMTDILVDDDAGVSFVVDQQPVAHSARTLPTNRSA